MRVVLHSTDRRPNTSRSSGAGEEEVNRTIVPGPTYAEMCDPTQLPVGLLESASAALTSNELAPVNLFNINWKNGGTEVERIILPRELTGVQANIIVLSGRNFPSGSMKVGPAYTTLAEAEALDRSAAGRPQHHWAQHWQLRHRYCLRERPEGLPGDRRDAGHHEPGAVRTHTKVRRRARPDARHRVGCHPHPRTHAQRVRQQARSVTSSLPSLS